MSVHGERGTRGAQGKESPSWSSLIPFPLQGEVGAPGNKGSKGDKGDAVSVGPQGGRWSWGRQRDAKDGVGSWGPEKMGRVLRWLHPSLPFPGGIILSVCDSAWL